MPTGRQHRGDTKPNYRELTENCEVIVTLSTSDSTSEKQSFRELTENCEVIVTLSTSDSTSEKQSFRLFEVVWVLYTLQHLTLRNIEFFPHSAFLRFVCFSE